MQSKLNPVCNPRKKKKKQPSLELADSQSSGVKNAIPSVSFDTSKLSYMATWNVFFFYDMNMEIMRYIFLCLHLTLSCSGSISFN